MSIIERVLARMNVRGFDSFGIRIRQLFLCKRCKPLKNTQQ